MEPNRVVRVVPRCLARSLIERSGRKIELRLYASVRNSQESLARKERHYYLLLNVALVGKHNIIVNQICGLSVSRVIATFQRTDANRAHRSSLTVAETASTFKGWYGAASSTQPSKLITKMKRNSGSPLDAADGFDHLTRRERWNPKTPHCPERGYAPACRTFFTDYSRQVGMATEMASLQGWPEERFSVVRRRVGKVHPVSRIGPPPCAVRCFALHRGIATARKLSSQSKK